HPRRSWVLAEVSVVVSSGISRIGLKRLNGYSVDRWSELSHAGPQNNNEPKPPSKKFEPTIRAVVEIILTDSHAYSIFFLLRSARNDGVMTVQRRFGLRFGVPSPT